MLLKHLGQDTENEIIKEKNKILISNSNIRIDENKEFISDNEFGKNRIIYNKKCSFGKMLENEHLTIKDKIDLFIDKQTGEIVKYGSMNSWPFGAYPNSFIFGKQFITDNVKNLKDYTEPIINANLSDNTGLHNLFDCFENSFQLHYLPVVGMILSFFSSIILTIPYKMTTIIDNKFGYNIIDVHSGMDNKELIKNKLKEYILLLDSLFMDFKEECEKEKRNIRAHIFVYEYGIFIKIKDINYNFELNYNINISDHCRILQANEYYNSKEYSKSNLLHNLLKLKIPTIIDTLGSVYLEEGDM